jgi:putative ABC transport system substrate-binding protein
MRRREFITLLAGVAGWPVAASAQQPGEARRIAVLMGFSENNPGYRSWIAAFVQRLAQLGWLDDRNLRIDIRWTNGDIEQARTFAKELVALKPDVIFAATTPVTAALQRQTRTIPIVFVVVSDPVGAGFVTSLPRPGGNITGFINAEAAMGGKWLQLLKEIAPDLGRVALMFNPDTAPGGGSYFLNAFEVAARSSAVEPITARVRSDAEIEAVITRLGGEQGGLVITPDSFMAVRNRALISAVMRNKVPTMFELPLFARQGGLMSYGANLQDLFPRAAEYVDRILRGATSADLPVQVPTKFDLAINLRTARELGLNVPPTLLARADELIE